MRYIAIKAVESLMDLYTLFVPHFNYRGIDRIVEFDQDKITDLENVLNQTVLGLSFGFLNGFTDDLSELKYAIQDCVDDLRTDEETILKVKTCGNGLAFYLTGALMTTISTQLNDENFGLGTQLINVLTRLEKEQMPNWIATGENFALGLSSGITSMNKKVRLAAVFIANVALQAVKDEWSTRSPSEEAEALGILFDMGLANGISTYAHAVDDSASALADSALDTLRSTLSNITGILLDEMDTDPVIRPVLDMSNIIDGAEYMNRLFMDDREIGDVFSGRSFRRGTDHLSLDNGRPVNEQSNSDVVNAITDLSNRFDNLSNAVANMQLVMDTGTLIGHIDTKINQRLGVLAGRRERGN